MGGVCVLSIHNYQVWRNQFRNDIRVMARLASENLVLFRNEMIWKWYSFWWPGLLVEGSILVSNEINELGLEMLFLVAGFGTERFRLNSKRKNKIDYKPL
jgi:hypothetical protein